MSVRGKNPYKRPDAFTQGGQGAGLSRAQRLQARGDRSPRPALQARADACSTSAPRRARGRCTRRRRSAAAASSSPSISSEIAVSLGANVEVVQGDALSLANEALALLRALRRRALATWRPSTTGNRVADQARSFELFDARGRRRERARRAGGELRRQDLHGRGLPEGARARPRPLRRGARRSGPRARAPTATSSSSSARRRKRIEPAAT